MIQKILQPDSKRITINEIFNDPWILKEANKGPMKVNFNKLAGFAKYSKVNIALILGQEASSYLYRNPTILKISRKFRKFIQANGSQSRWRNFHLIIENCS